LPIVGSTSWGAQQFIEILSDAPLRAIHFDSDPNLIVYQLKVPESCQGRALQEFLPNDKYKTLSLVRNNQQLPISSVQFLETGDEIYLMADPAEIESLRSQLGSQQEQIV
jgi:NhaP-type Na+/H+ and K+/H+ antiporter